MAMAPVAKGDARAAWTSSDEKEASRSRASFDEPSRKRASYVKASGTRASYGDVNGRVSNTVTLSDDCRCSSA